MSRFFNGKKIELLAPAGTIETFKSMAKANCDAIYFGGKTLNMRMIRKGFNFSKDEVLEAIKIGHELNKKIYVTVNNLLNDYEINEATEYLGFLHTIPVDGIIIQDLGILQICKEQHFDQFEIHASVMMNVHNMAFARTLKELGLSRAVLSREMNLKDAKNLQNQTGIETEYFIHGDMCTVNDSNCYYSSFIFGNSANRGRCLKPCRWPYRIKRENHLYPTEYPLAAKDMCMYEYIPQLIEACVTSFKIEGRMRDTDFIVNLVNTYGEAIDRYIEDPLSFDEKKYSLELFESRKRDFTTAYAFSKPGLDFINSRYEGTGKFYSTGKVFSTPTEEPELTTAIIQNIESQLKEGNHKTTLSPNLSVKVNNFIQAELCIELGVTRIYIPCEVLEPDKFLSLEQLKYLASIKRNTQLYFDLPQMMDEMQFDKIDHYLFHYGYLFDGLLVSNLGALKRYGSQYRIVSDYNMNIYNHKALECYHSLGVSECTLSIETKSNELAKFISLSKVPLELIVHGPLRVMYLDHDLYENTEAFMPMVIGENQHIDNSILALVTDKGKNPVYRDQNHKNHLFTSKELCLLPILHSLYFQNLTSFRIEGQTYRPDVLKTIIEIYQRALTEPIKCKEFFSAMKPDKAGFTAGSLSFNILLNRS